MALQSNASTPRRPPPRCPVIIALNLTRALLYVPELLATEWVPCDTNLMCAIVVELATDCQRRWGQVSLSRDP